LILLISTSQLSTSPALPGLAQHITSYASIYKPSSHPATRASTALKGAPPVNGLITNHPLSSYTRTLDIHKQHSSLSLSYVPSSVLESLSYVPLGHGRLQHKAIITSRGLLLTSA
jgi:hypothetical protein